MKQLGFQDETFYWGRSGRRATVIEVECELTHGVCPDTLQAAVLGALRVHTNFRARPKVAGRRFLVETPAVEEVTVVPEDGRPRNLGPKETAGLMFYVTYGERHFTLHVFHGLGDLRAICAFLRTVLAFYFHPGDNSLPQPDSIDSFPCYEQLLQKGAPGEPKGKYNPGEHDIFHLPERLYSRSSTRQRIIDIDVPLAPMLAFARENGSSVVPVLNAVIGRAFRQCYDVGEREIVCYVPIDLRRVFHFETGGNGALAFALPYAAETDRLSVGERARRLRAEMEVQTRPENLYTTVARLRADFDHIFSVLLPVRMVAPLVVRNGRKKDFAHYTYGISYGGHLDLGESSSQVQDVGISAGSYSYPLWLIACEHGGTVRLRLVQAFESDRVATAIHRELSALFPGTAYTDRGHHDFDSLRIKDLARIKPNEIH